MNSNFHLEPILNNINYNNMEIKLNFENTRRENYKPIDFFENYKKYGFKEALNEDFYRTHYLSLIVPSMTSGILSDNPKIIFLGGVVGITTLLYKLVVEYKPEMKSIIKERLENKITNL